MKLAHDYQERTIHRVLKQKVEQYGNRDFLYFRDQVFGYEDFDRESDKVAAGLQSLGLAKGDKVAIIMGNRPEYLFLWFGLCKLGAIEVPINTAHKGNILAYMLDKADCRFVVVESKFLDRIDPMLERLPKLEGLLILADSGDPMPQLDRPALDYRRVIDNGGLYDEVEVIWRDPFAIIYTSGTTGQSKGCVLAHNFAYHQGRLIIEMAEYDEKDRLYNALPLFHTNAQVLSTIPALMSGARMVLGERFSASRFWDEVRHYGCTEFNFIGGILPILFKAPPRTDDADNPLRVMVGAGVPKDIFHAFEERFGLMIIEGYGSTETGTPLMNTPINRQPGVCGRPRPDYDVKVVDDHGLALGPGKPGELLIRAKEPYSTLLEYYKMPEQTMEAWRDLWFHTGDYLYYDEDDNYFFVDRKKDALRRRGENISSFEVEAVIRSHPAVQEAAAVAVASEVGEDEVMVCLTLQPGQSLKPEELISHCEERMAYFMVPRYLRIMDSLPKTITERVEKYRLREAGITEDTWDREKAGYKLKR